MYTTPTTEGRSMLFGRVQILTFLDVDLTEYCSLGLHIVECNKCHAIMWKEERTNKNLTKGISKT